MAESRLGGPNVMAADEGPPDEIQFHFIKSSNFRVVYADGAYGGSSPRGYVHFAFYSERAPLPRTTVRKLLRADGNRATFGPEEVQEARPGVVRDVEVDVIMDLQAAKEFSRWLSEKIVLLEHLNAKNQGEQK